MKMRCRTFLLASISLISIHSQAQTSKADTSHRIRGGNQLFLDVHRLGPGKVKYDAVAGAHAKDLAVQAKYGVDLKKFWVDEQNGLIYCLATAKDSSDLRKTHAEAHGLLPDHIYKVTDGIAAPYLKGKTDLYLDIHELGAGHVTAKDVAAAHQKDLACQKKHGVNLINYWFNEKDGVIICLSQAKDSTSIIETHKEAHGLVPTKILKVKEGE